MLLVCTVNATDTNDEFVRRGLERYFTEAFSMMPEFDADSLHVDLNAPPVDNLNVSGAALATVMNKIGLRRLPDPQSDVGLRINLTDIDFRYDSHDGGAFSRGEIYRVLTVSGSFSLLSEDSPIWDNYLVRDYSEQINASEREDIERSSSSLFNAELPPGPVQKIWEPVIVTSIVGGLVYLFFASR
jgi:hypothetical protein